LKDIELVNSKYIRIDQFDKPIIKQIISTIPILKEQILENLNKFT